MFVSNYAEKITLWKLDLENQPKNEAEFLVTISFLERTGDWVKANEDHARRLCVHLSETNLSGSSEILAKARKIQNSLVSLYPSLFPTVKIRMGGEEKQIPEVVLMEKSEKFRIMLSGLWRAQGDNQVLIDPPIGADLKVVQNFLHFLAHGKVEFDLKNTPFLLLLAQEHCVTQLTIECNKFLEKELKIDSLQDMLKLATLHNIEDLKWHCLALVSKHCEDPSSLFFSHALANEKCREAKEMLQIIEEGKLCFENGIEPCFSEEFKVRTVSLSSSDLDFSLLKCLSEKYGVEGLKIKKNFAISNNLLQLEEIFKMPAFLSIQSNQLKDIPTKWLEYVKEIDLWKCSIEQLDLPSAKVVKARHCPKLCHLNAPNAILINCIHTSIKSLNADLAEEIIANNTMIESLHASMAKRVIARTCRFLKVVHASMVEDIDCSGSLIETADFNFAKKVRFGECSRLKRACVLRAEEAEFGKCILLEFLECPSVRKLTITDALIDKLDVLLVEKFSAKNCQNLTTLILPKARSVEIDGCIRLSVLKADKAEKMNCSKLPIQELLVPQAVEIDCSFTHVSQLIANNAKWLNCRLTPLVHLDAPLVETIDCSSTELSLLYVPQGKKVISRDCAKLTHLLANEAQTIDCCICPKLVLLESDKAEKMSCLDCTSLPRINGPKIVNLLSKRCSQLKEISAPLAEIVITSDCPELAEINVPNVKQLDYDGCPSLRKGIIASQDEDKFRSNKKKSLRDILSK